MVQTARFMQLSKFFLPIFILTLYLFTLTPQQVYAGGVVNDCSSYSAPQGLQSALVGGGTVTFNCGSTPPPIIVPEITIASNTQIQGGGVITLSGNFSNRIFNITSTTSLIIDGLTLINGKTASFGGAISVDTANGTTLTVIDSTLYNNYAKDYGGAIYFQPKDGSGNLIISHSSLISNSAGTDSGGAIYLINSHLTINNNSLLSQNKVTGNDGGAILAFAEPGKEKNVIIDNSIISNNSAGDEGGGLMLATGGDGVLNINITNSKITTNTSQGSGGGGIRSRSKNVDGAVNLIISNSEVSFNKATGSNGAGGAISVDQGISTIDNTDLISNTAIAGGGLSIEGGTITVTSGSLISQNQAQAGGGVSVTAGQLTINNTTIANNQAQTIGGGMALTTVGTINFVANNLTLSNNSTVNGDGGGIYAEGNNDVVTVNATFNNSTISNNIAGTTGSGNGGGLNMRRGTVNFIATRVENNTAKVNGGGLYFGTGGVQQVVVNANISDNSVIDGNKATTGFGGGIGVQATSNNLTTLINLAITATTFSNNQAIASNGGGLAVDTSNGSATQITVNGATIKNNQAQLSGGGIFINRPGFNTTKISLLNNTLIDNNTATSGNGGGLALQANESGNLIVATDGVSITNNKSMAGTGGGLNILALGNSKSNTTISNTTISTNQANAIGGGGFYHQRGAGFNSIYNNTSLLTIRNSTIDNNVAGSSGGGGFWSAGSGSSPAIISIINTTISGNKTQSTTGHGGGLQINKGAVSIIHATIYSNTATGRGGGLRIANTGANVTIQNSILAGNVGAVDGPDCDPIPPATLTSNNYNLLGSSKSCTNIFKKTNDQEGPIAGVIIPRLSPLALNIPGNTKTHALLANSPALDYIKPLNSAACPVSAANNQDQRGSKRPSGLGCDIGAYEYQGPAAFTVAKITSSPLIRGAKFTYTLSIFNTGSLPAANVVIRDTLPVGVNFISASNGSSPQWIIPIAAGETVTQTLTVSSCLASVTNNNYGVLAGNPWPAAIGPAITSTLATPTITVGFAANPLGLSLTVSDQTTTNGSPIVKSVWDFGDGITTTGTTAAHNYFTPGLRNVTLTVTDGCGYSSSLTKNIQIGDKGLGVTIAASQDPIFPSSQLTYSIFITSTGLLTVSNIDVFNMLPPEVSFVPGSLQSQTSGGLVGTAPPNLAFSLVLSPGRVARFTYTVLVKNSLPNNWPVTNTVSITTPDLSEAVTATVVNTVVSSNTLALHKQVSSDSITPNNLLTYTLNYTVSGNSPVTNITIRDQIPANTQFVSASLNGNSTSGPTGNMVSWAAGNALVAASGIQTGVAKLTVRVSIPLTNGLLILNTATMTSSENSTPIQATATSTVKSSYTLQLSKVVEPRIILGGQLLTYTLYYTASGNGTANEVLLIDTVPDKTTFISATAIPVIEPILSGTGTIVWAVGSVLTPNSGITQTSGKVSMVVKANNLLPNGTTIINSAEINSAEQITSTKASARAVAANAELTVEKTTSTSSVIAGRVANYIIILRNAGNITATNVFVRDILPTGFTYSATLSISETNATRTATNNPTTGTTTPRWDTWTIAPQGKVQIELQTQVSPNITTGIYSNTIERGSNEANYNALPGLAPIKVDQFPEFSILKKAVSPIAIAGGVATYIITIRNTGTAAATGVKVTDALPTGFTYKSTLEIVEGTSLSRNARIREITVTNPITGTTKPVWGSWTIPVNGVLSITYNVDIARSVPADFYENSTTVQANEAIAGVKPTAMVEVEVKQMPELFINKTTSTPVVVAGNMATYTIAIFNFGTSSATKVVVSDVLPSNFKYHASTFETASATRGLNENPTAGDTTLLWRGWTIERGGAVTITFTADVANSAPDITYNNPAYASSEQSGQVDDDPLFGRDANTLPEDTAEDENVTITHFPLLALEYSGPTLVAAGRTVTYTLTIRNIGSNNARRVALTQVLPSGFNYKNTLSIEEASVVRSINLNPSPNQRELVWGEWLMAVDGMVTITYLVDIPTTVAEGSYTTSLNLGSSNATAVNQEHGIQVTRRPILTLNKMALTPIVAKGELATYQIVVQNEGIIEATNVVLTDILPAGGFAYRDTLSINENLATRTKISNPTDSALAPEWSAWTIEPGGSVIITFRADVLRFVEDNNYDNALMVSSDEGVLVSNDGTNNPTDNVIVGNYPLLFLTKNTSTPEVNAGGLANYIIVVNNIGTAPATEVVITDTLPNGFTYVSTNKIEEKLSNRTSSVNPPTNSTLAVWGTWTIQRNGAITITLVTKISTTLTQGSYTNTAIASNNEVNQLPDRQPIGNIQVRVGPRKLAQTYLPIIIKQPSTTPTATPTETSVVVTPTATPTTPSSVVAPDLIVERLIATSKFVQLVIKNQGNAPVTNEFWVDFYVDPNPPPTKVNEVWYENGRSKEGLAWGVTSSALPINPNDVLILTFSIEPGAPNLYAAPAYSRYSGTMAPGTPVYAQVDSVNSDTTYGGVLETHEILLGQPYNNITLSLLSTSDTVQLLEVPPLKQLIQPDTTSHLPKRP